MRDDLEDRISDIRKNVPGCHNGDVFKDTYVQAAVAVVCYCCDKVYSSKNDS